MPKKNGTILAYSIGMLNLYVFTGLLRVAVITLMVTLPTFGTVAWASGHCPVAVDTFKKIDFKDEPLAVSEAIELLIERLTDDVGSRFGGKSFVNDALTKILKNLSIEKDHLMGLQDQLLKEQPVRVEKFEEQVARIEYLRTQFEGLLSGQATQAQDSLRSELDFQELIRDPTNIRAEVEYSVESATGEVLRVVFSEDLVANAFLSRSLQVTRGIKRSLQQIPKGLYGGNYAGTGIIRVLEDNTVVEVRFKGKGANFRLFGYLNEGVIHFVYTYNNSNHNAGAMNKIAKIVNSIKVKRQAGAKH